MIKRKHYLNGLLFLFFVGSTVLFVQEENRPVDSRIAYEAFIREHPYNQNQKGAQRSKGNSEEDKERSGPAERMQQDFLMTMDPALKRPTPELLPQIMRDQKSARTYGTLPGESAAPWLERGPKNVGGRTRALMWDPNDGTGKKVWAGGVAGGLWFNSDITSSNSPWTAVDDFWSNLAITCIAYDPNDTETFYVGTGEGWYNADAVRGQGIWKTTNGGTTWTQLTASTSFLFVNDIVVRDDGGTSEVYAAVARRSGASNSEGLFRSVDGGTSFTQQLPNIAGKSYPPGVSDIEIGADGAIWAGTTFAGSGSGGGLVLRSSDGESWSTVYTASVNEFDGRVELATSAEADTVAYALIEKDYKIFEMKRTADAGATWVNMTLPDDDDNGIDADDFTRGQAFYDLVAAVNPEDDSTIVVGGINLHMSTDAGQTWQQISKWSNNPNMGGKPYSYVHADHHAIQFKPGSSNEVVFGNDGGVFWTSDFSDPANTDKIVSRNSDYNVTQFYSAAVHPDKAKNYFLAGAQDNGTQRFQSAGVNVTDEVSGGDGGFAFIDQTNGSEQFAAYTNNNYYFTDNSWQTAVTVESDDETGRFINPTDYDDELNILYSASTESTIGRFSNSPTGWVRNDLAVSLGTKATHLRVSPHTRNSTTLFVGTEAGRVFKITKANSGVSASSEITGSSFPNGWVSCIEVGQDESHLLVTFSNYGVISVWYTEDGGATWSNKEGDLPNFPVRWAMFNPTNFDEVILATEMGIWGTKSVTAASPTWAQFSNGLANVRVDMLQMRDSDFEVIAATHGRGLYSSSIFAGQSSLTANFVAKNRATEKNTAVEFVDRSKGATSWAWTFDGGTPATSTSQNPSVTYATDGAYTVTLVSKNASGATSTKTIEGYVQVGPVDDGPIEALFTSDIQTVVQGNTVKFTNASKGMPESVIWFFEGGTPSASTELNPTVKYETTGSFDVELVVFKEGEQNKILKANYVTVSADNSTLKAKFKVNTPTVFVGNQIKFTDISTGGATSWAWTFEGGTPSISSSQNPVVVYNTSGKFNVTLKVTKGAETNTLTIEDHVGVYVSTGIEFSDGVIDSYYSNANPDFTGLYGGECDAFFTNRRLLAPTNVNGNTDTFVSLPLGSYVTVEFTDNVIINAPGQDDIFIRECEGVNEYANVYVSANGVDFSFIGTAIGTNSSNVTTTFDLETINFQEPVTAIKVIGLDLGGASPGFDLLSVSGIAGAIIGNDPPLAPTLLTAEAKPSEVKLSWEDNAIDEAGFFVERSTNGTTFTKIKDLPVNASSYTSGGLTEATKYFFRVAATNKNGDSDYSNVVEVTTTEFTIEAPTGLNVIANTSVSVVLDWVDNSDDEESFEIQRSEDNDQFITLGTIGADTISFDDLSLMPSSTYFYKVKGVNATGESDYTEVVEVKTLDPLEAPTALTLAKATGRKVVLSWVDNSLRETAFIVERAVGTGAFATLTELEADVTEFTDDAVLELTDYKYRLYAVNDVLEVSSKTTSLLVSTPEKGFADLTITDLNAPVSQSAKEITLGATVSNLSDDPTEGAFEVSFYLSKDENLSLADEFLGAVAFEEMEDGAEQTASGTFDMVILTAGEYFIIAVVDEESVIEEKDEANNKKSASIILTEVLSVADDLQQNIKVYPNPTTAVVNVTSEAGKIGPFNIRLTDLSGKLLKVQAKVEGTTRIDMTDLPSGVYLLTIQKEGSQYSTRILKR
ncbi:PKD domain-containing protein [uncultured Imperialibacter sp.]|uniref:PKD domain-containing protein n=1 Tax=uncultured Imperialibacter sp. TaxID=1672639 RepID=UPI0030DA6508|tara:strand:+ start:59432 stop:64570 length:5139 start_codon:yes stop_codon:yes gene_type:complete